MRIKKNEQINVILILFVSDCMQSVLDNNTHCQTANN